MRLIKVVAMTFVLFTAALFLSGFLLSYDPLGRIFNGADINGAIQLAQKCQIKSLGEGGNPSGEIYLGLTNGSHKYLDDKYEVNDKHFRVYNDSYNQFFKLVNDSKARCGFETPIYME